jgi:2'-5' RNA ligase
MSKTPGLRTTSTMAAIYPPESFLKYAKRHAHPDMIGDGLHVTLYYIGDTTEDSNADLIEGLQKAMQAFPPLEMYVNGAGCFFNEGKAVRLLLMNAVGLDLLRSKVMTEMWRKGFVGKQKHGFCPHLTLEYHEQSTLPPEWETCALEDYPRFSVDRVFLVRSNEVVAEVLAGGEVVKAG